MCLFPFKNKADIANKDIICYKVVTEIPNSISNECFLSIFCAFNYYVGREYIEPLFKVSVESKTSSLIPSVNKGFHSYMHLKDAVKIVKSYSIGFSFLKEKYIILKCVIPKGTLYYKGSSHIEDPLNILPLEYCSRQIKIVAWKTPEGKWNKK